MSDLDAEVEDWRVNALNSHDNEEGDVIRTPFFSLTRAQIDEAVRLMRRARVEVPAEVVERCSVLRHEAGIDGEVARFVLSLPRAAEGGDRG